MGVPFGLFVSVLISVRITRTEIRFAYPYGYIQRGTAFRDHGRNPHVATCTTWAGYRSVGIPLTVSSAKSTNARRKCMCLVSRI